jgi:hypothetical protein
VITGAVVIPIYILMETKRRDYSLIVSVYEYGELIALEKNTRKLQPHQKVMTLVQNSTKNKD